MAKIPGDRSLEVKAVSATFGILALISISLRCYVRLKLVKNFGWDDGLMVAAVVFFTFYGCCMFTGAVYGTGQHEANLTEENKRIAKRFWWLCEMAFAFASVAAKASICVFLLRITVRKYHRWTLYLVMTITAFTGLVFFFVLMFQCRPVQYFWDRRLQGTCVDWQVIIAMSWLYSVFAGMCDFTVGILPIFLVWNLHMDKKSKIGVVIILGVACIASSATIIRMPYLHTFANPDFLYATTDIALWTDVEIGLGIFASCMATLRPLFRQVREMTQGTEMTPSDQFRSAEVNRSTGAFKRLENKLRPNGTGVTMTTVRSTARGYNGMESEEDLNPTAPPETKKSLIVQRTFEVTTESVESSGSGKHQENQTAAASGLKFDV